MSLRPLKVVFFKSLAITIRGSLEDTISSVCLSGSPEVDWKSAGSEPELDRMWTGSATESGPEVDMKWTGSAPEVG